MLVETTPFVMSIIKFMSNEVMYYESTDALLEIMVIMSNVI